MIEVLFYIVCIITDVVLGAEPGVLDVKLFSPLIERSIYIYIYIYIHPKLMIRNY